MSENYSAEDIERAKRAFELRKLCGHPSDEVLHTTALYHMTYAHTDLMSQVARNASSIFGAHTACHELEYTNDCRFLSWIDICFQQTDKLL